ncbi:MAG: serine/threonine protein kinase [Myxococcales bacterium]|nr:serine/threonine protein kinase [Myxococcales bacterium]
MVEVIAVLMTFGMPMYIVKKVVEARSEKHRREHEAKMAMLRGGAAGAGSESSARELAELQKERKLLVERIENLETIVCSVDYELNQKVARLIEEQRSLVALPAGAKATPVASGAPAALAGGAGAGKLADLAAGGARAIVGPPPAVAPAPEPKADSAHVEAMSPTMTAAPRATTLIAEHGSELRTGSVLANRYRVQKLLGRGGMGAVYLCDDEVLGELVALKVISSAWASDQVAMTERFKREAQAARKVSSPSVIRIHDLGEAPPRLLYLSMEYFPGRTLSQVIAQRGLVPLADCKDYLGQICEGLAAAHDVGVVHRDLKPGNVLVGERSAVKLIDFGLAKATAAEGLTATGALLGTPHYMAPEQIRGKNVDARADIYSLGALAFHLLTGRPPFIGDNPISVGFAHLSETPVAVRSLRPDVSEALDKMVARALSKDPGERPGDARAFREAVK